MAQKAVLAEPSRLQIRQQLATLSLQNSDHKSARAILDGASSSSSIGYGDLRQSVGMRAIAAANDDQDAAEVLARKAVMLAPWDDANWLACAYSRCAAA